jgi:hypothetical protein
VVLEVLSYQEDLNLVVLEVLSYQEDFNQEDLVYFLKD